MDTSRRDSYADLFDELRQRDWGTAPVETRWMGFLFHIANLDNAVSILENGMLYSRFEADRRQLIRHDSAASEVISSTGLDIQRSARLYFRPRTPTFYHNEGFRTKVDLRRERYDAHCPIPIAFIFDAPTVLAMRGVRFSAVNLATHGARLLDTLADFRNLPFEKIYHEGPVSDRSITSHRQAEVAVPGALRLNGTLRAVRCRTDAERMTLRHALSMPVQKAYDRLIRTNALTPLFQAERLFIERVDILDNAVVIDLHLPNRPFTFEAECTGEFEQSGDRHFSRTWKLEWGTNSRLSVPLPSSARQARSVIITLRLDENIAYRAMHRLFSDDVPF